MRLNHYGRKFHYLELPMRLLELRYRLEVIVDAEPDQVGAQAVRRTRYREAPVGEVEVEPLGFGRPVRYEADFDAGAGGPAGAGARLRQVAGAVDAQLADREAC